VKRREFITLLGGGAAWPLAARAQQSNRMRRIAVLMNLSVSDAVGQARVAAFSRGLQELGWTEGRNIHIDYRWVGGESERSRASAKDVIDLQPEVIFAQGTLSLQSVSQQTRSLPIVFSNVSDPVGDGFVAQSGASGRQHYRICAI
jgi:putative ABC transport system substrate-binding protein